MRISLVISLDCLHGIINIYGYKILKQVNHICPIRALKLSVKEIDISCLAPNWVAA